MQNMFFIQIHTACTLLLDCRFADRDLLSKEPQACEQRKIYLFCTMALSQIEAKRKEGDDDSNICSAVIVI